MRVLFTEFALLVGGGVIALAICLCWLLAVQLGHTTYVTGSGKQFVITIPPLSQCSSHSPEYYVWFLLVGTANLGFLLPPLAMVQMVAFKHSNLAGHTFWVLYPALLGLLMETIIPLDEDIYQEKQSAYSVFHQYCAAGFFYLTILHMILVMAAHTYWSKWSKPIFADLSYAIKVGATFIVLFSLWPKLYPSIVCNLVQPLFEPRGHDLRCGSVSNDVLGIQQRCIILGLLVFLSSYSLDFRNGPDTGLRGSDPRAASDLEMPGMSDAFAQQQLGEQKVPTHWEQGRIPQGTM